MSNINKKIEDIIDGDAKKHWILEEATKTVAQKYIKNDKPIGIIELRKKNHKSKPKSRKTKKKDCGCNG